MRALAIASAALLAGCGNYAGYQHLQVACGIEEVGTGLLWHDLSGGAPPLDPTISARCSEELGAMVGLDWDAFSSSPRDLAAVTDPASLLIAGLYSLLAADLGTLGELNASLDEVEALGEELPEGIGSPTQQGDPASPLFTTLVDDLISELAPGNEDECGWDYSMSYGRHGRVSSCESAWFTDSRTLLEEVSSFDIAATLVHEAGHAFLPGHEQLTPGWSEDPDPARVYGLETRYRYTWLAANADSPAVDQDDWQHAAEMALNRCLHIRDLEGFRPCGEYRIDRESLAGGASP